MWLQNYKLFAEPTNNYSIKCDFLINFSTQHFRTPCPHSSWWLPWRWCALVPQGGQAVINQSGRWTSSPGLSVGGSGGNRTLVRTRKPYAFYMLIPAFVFVMLQDLGYQQHPYPLKFHPASEARPDYSRFYLRRLISGFGTTSSERRLVLSPCDGIKLVIYCASIKQREHTHCCQLIFRPTWLWRTQPSLRMLTYHFGLPSNPVTPMIQPAKVRTFSEICNFFSPFFQKHSKNKKSG